jgi:predicted PurR-regulated permease PerM
VIDAQTDRPFDLARATFQLLAIGALILTTFWILRPFLVSLTWAVMIVVATWPVLKWTQARLGGRRGLATAVMTLALFLAFALPLYFVVVTVFETARHLADLTHWLEALAVPPPPAWLDTIPAVGSRLAESWRRLAAASPEEMAAFLLPYASGVAVGLVTRMGSAGRLLLDVALTVLIAGILYSTGEAAARGAARFARRLGGRHGEATLVLAGLAIRAVAVGVIGTAAIMSVLVGIGLAVTGVPFPVLLSLVMFVLAVAHVGPIPVLIPASIWVWARYGAGWGSALLAWTVLCIAVDKVVQPILIRRGGANLPLLLIFAGVLGGLIAFGVIGLFIGPLVLAVAHALISAWMAQEHADETPAPEMSGERA